MRYYNQILHQNAELRIKWFVPLIKSAVETGKLITTKRPISLNGMNYTLYFVPKVTTDTDGLITLSLRWTDEGETYTQHIDVIAEESNLVSGSSVYFFQCDGHKCKKLFYVGNRFRSRTAFWHRYATQNKSRHQRGFIGMEEPYRPYGKKYYRNKLTPYGRRCLKYERQMHRTEESLFTLLHRIGRRKNPTRKQKAK